MKTKQIYKILILVIISMAVIVTSGMIYIYGVRDSMCVQSLSNMLGITEQGSHAISVHISKDVKMLESLAQKLSASVSEDIDSIQACLSIVANLSSDYAVIDMGKGIMYTKYSDQPIVLQQDELEAYASISGIGVIGPVESKFTGLLVLQCCKEFTFSDGTKGIVQKDQLLSALAEEFSLSFYNNRGFSHIVEKNGRILVHSEDPVDTCNFENFYDIMDDDNKEEDIIKFKDDIAAGKSGVTRFKCDGKEYFYIYAPIESQINWYMLSMIPGSVIFENADHVVKITGVFLFVIVGVMAVSSAFILLIKLANKGVREKEAEIRYREQLFGILANSNDDVYLMMSIDNYQIEYVSPNIQRVLGIMPEEAKKSSDFLWDRIWLSEEEPDRDSLKGVKFNEPVSFKTERVNKSTGEHRFFTETVYCADVEGKDKLIAVLSDRTVEKQNSKALEDALEIAKIANEAKTAFLSNMSHDMRTPMNAVVGLATLLERDFDQPERVKEHTRKITASSQYLLGLMNNVLDMSRIESGKTTLNVSEINLAEIVEELGSVIRPQARIKNQEFEITVQDIHNEDLLGDKSRICQILINLLSNAVKYTPDGGKIDMVIKQMSTDAKDCAYMRFIVRDNGMGMSEEYQKIIFDPFTREKESMLNKVSGTGLGMAITKNLIDLMGGTISIDSKQGKGTTFTVDLILRLQEKDCGRSFWINHGVTAMLVVDSEEEVRTSITAAMAGTRVSVQFAADGDSAVQEYTSAHNSGTDYSIVLIDWRIPENDWTKSAAKLREVIPDSVPIFIFTAFDWSETEEAAKAAGVNGFLTKPFFLSNFKQTIEQHTVGKGKSLCEQSKMNSLTDKRILIVDDNQINSEILIDLLSDVPGLICDTASDGKEALDMFINSPVDFYDVIIMDVQMPVMNGYESTRQIRASGRTDSATVPIIAMTANAFAEDVKKALECGMNAHMAKPVDLEKLEIVINENMRK